MEGIRPCLVVSVFLGGQEGERTEEGGKGRRRVENLSNYCMSGEMHRAEQCACVNGVHVSPLPHPPD